MTVARDHSVGLFAMFGFDDLLDSYQGQLSGDLP